MILRGVHKNIQKLHIQGKQNFGINNSVEIAYIKYAYYPHTKKESYLKNT